MGCFTIFETRAATCGSKNSDEALTVERAVDLQPKMNRRPFGGGNIRPLITSSGQGIPVASVSDADRDRQGGCELHVLRLSCMIIHF